MNDQKAEEKKPRRAPGPRMTNAAERIARILAQLPKAVRTPTAQYAMAVAMDAPEPRPDDGKDDSEEDTQPALFM